MQYYVSVYKAQYVLKIALLLSDTCWASSKGGGVKGIGACGSSSPQGPHMPHLAVGVDGP